MGEVYLHTIMTLRDKSRTGQDVKRERLERPGLEEAKASRQAARRQDDSSCDEQIVAVAELEDLGVDLRHLNGHSTRYLDRYAD
jgi:hypothetical protein